MAGFEALQEQALQLGIEGKIWLDGSFLTEKIDPGDVDWILVVSNDYMDKGTPEQAAFIEWLISNERDPKNSFHCDTDVVFRFPKDSPWYEHFTGNILEHWERDVYGKCVSSGDPKGIVLISLSKPKQLPEATAVISTAQKIKEGEKR